MALEVEVSLVYDSSVELIHLALPVSNYGLDLLVPTKRSQNIIIMFTVELKEPTFNRHVIK